MWIEARDGDARIFAATRSQKIMQQQTDAHDFFFR